MLQKLILKHYWPLLRCINLKDAGGYYSRNGEDALVFSLLFNHITKNKCIKVIEINKPEIFPYSLTTIFLTIGSCSGVLINTRSHLVLSYAKEPIELPGLKVISGSNYYDEFGCLNSYKESSLVHEYSLNEQLTNSLCSNQMSYSLVILNVETDAMQILDELLSESSVFSIMILNNTSGLFSIGDMNLRNKLAQKGFIFHTRLNGRDDIFVLSELINGFPSSLFGLMNTTTLQRWVSDPPGSDYSTPR